MGLKLQDFLYDEDRDAEVFHKLCDKENRTTCAIGFDGC